MIVLIARTGAIETTVLGAGAAGFLETLAQSLSGAMAADLEIVDIGAELHSERGWVAFGKFELFNEFGVFGLERGKQLTEALTEFALPGLIRCSVQVELIIRRLDVARFNGAVAIEIDDGVIEDSVEPRDEPFVIADFAGRFQRFGEAVLQDIFGGVGIGNFLADEREKLLPVSQQLADQNLIH